MISFEQKKKTALNLSISQKIIKHRLDKTKKKEGERKNKKKQKKKKKKREKHVHMIVQACGLSSLKSEAMASSDATATE